MNKELIIKKCQEIINLHNEDNSLYDLLKTVKADGLTTLDKWIPSVIYYNGKKTIQYLYIKSLEYDNELIYTVTSTDCDTIFKCTKRITSEK